MSFSRTLEMILFQASGVSTVVCIDYFGLSSRGQFLDRAFREPSTPLSPTGRLVHTYQNTSELTYFSFFLIKIFYQQPNAGLLSTVS